MKKRQRKKLKNAEILNQRYLKMWHARNPVDVVKDDIMYQLYLENEKQFKEDMGGNINEHI